MIWPATYAFHASFTPKDRREKLATNSYPLLSTTPSTKKALRQAHLSCSPTCYIVWVSAVGALSLHKSLVTLKYLTNPVCSGPTEPVAYKCQGFLDHREFKIRGKNPQKPVSLWICNSEEFQSLSFYSFNLPQWYTSHPHPDLPPPIQISFQVEGPFEKK